MPAKPERRPQILRAAAALFLARGFQATRMDDLAAKLKLNKATIYHHFPAGKQELLFEIIASALKGISEELDGVDADAEPEQRIRRYLEAMVRFQSQHPNETVVYFQERPWLEQALSRPQHATVRKHEAHARALVRRAIQDGIDAGDFRPVDPSLTTFALMNAVTSTYEWFGHRKAGAQDVAGFYAQIAFDGLKKGPKSKPKRRRAGAKARARA